MIVNIAPDAAHNIVRYFQQFFLERPPVIYLLDQTCIRGREFKSAGANLKGQLALAVVFGGHQLGAFDRAGHLVPQCFKNAALNGIAGEDNIPEAFGSEAQRFANVRSPTLRQSPGKQFDSAEPETVRSQNANLFISRCQKEPGPDGGSFRRIEERKPARGNSQIAGSPGKNGQNIGYVERRNKGGIEIAKYADTAFGGYRKLD